MAVGRITDELALRTFVRAQVDPLPARVREVQAMLAPTPVAVTVFGSGWANYGFGFPGARYWKHGGVVHLDGLVTKSGGTPTAADVIFTLPAGYRPAGTLHFAVATGGTPTGGTARVTAAGEVQWLSGDTTEPDFTSLAGIHFLAETA